MGFYTVRTSLDPESQHLRNNTGKELYVTELPEQGAVRIEIRRNGYSVDQLVSMQELVCIDPRLLEYIMKVVIMKLEGTLEPLHIPEMI